MMIFLTDEFFSKILFIAGALHFCNIPAMLIAPRMLGWKEDLAKLQEINRRIVYVMGGGIILTILGTGIVVMFDPGQMVKENSVGHALACFLSLFWAYRFIVQVILYSKIWPGGVIGRSSHYGLASLFLFLTLVYGVAFWIGR